MLSSLYIWMTGRSYIYEDKSTSLFCLKSPPLPNQLSHGHGHSYIRNIWAAPLRRRLSEGCVIYLGPRAKDQPERSMLLSSRQFHIPGINGSGGEHLHG